MKKLFIIPILFLLLFPAAVWVVGQVAPTPLAANTGWLSAWALISLGIALIMAEVFVVPGFNIVGITGFLIALFGIGLSFEQYGTTWGLVAVSGTVVFTSGILWLAWKSGVWNHLVNQTVLPSLEERTAESHARRTLHLGKIGTTVTPLRPEGVVEIDGERVEVRTEGEYIAAGSSVKIVAMDSHKFIVRLN